MKYLFPGLALLALLILACCWSAQVVSSRTEAVLLPLERALGADLPEQADVRNAWVGRASETWEEGLGLLSCLVSHSYTREISEDLAELPLLSGAEFRRGCLRLQARLRNLAEMDLPRIGNVF